MKNEKNIYYDDDNIYYNYYVDIYFGHDYYMNGRVLFTRRCEECFNFIEQDDRFFRTRG